ncbi:TetR/AcrR family transcriptional regulator [Actinocrispum wychmicini]|uniref:TetR family transcriptional regulator n=1 Tax=Actinocrispum wychmicini TaxID=1213861 RepID=A0A4R2JBB6_9PSEU|nr:TetR/AcrR family transcriptional regulator [Actinocrispum wychmicini]TCO55222.1 TetR family transcriptional regulator [Actinocrispum wychmicini]
MPKRVPAGAAVLQPQVTEAITMAAFTELAEVGYGKLTMEGVARRAGVSKPTLYRRWSTKEQMVLAIVNEVAIGAADLPDTGTLHSDLRAYLKATAEGVTHPLAARIIPDLLAQAMRIPALADALQNGIGRGRRAKAAEILGRAIDRGELPADLDIELALDLAIAPLFWRLLLGGDPAAPDYLDKVTDMLVTAFGG